MRHFTMPNKYEDEVCSSCGRKEPAQTARHPNSGWDWFMEVRLCPDCALSNRGKRMLEMAIEKERLKIRKL